MRNWVVALKKEIPTVWNVYPAGFFPRGFHYKRDADALAAEVEQKGGKAEVRREGEVGSVPGMFKDLRPGDVYFYPGSPQGTFVKVTERTTVSKGHLEKRKGYRQPENPTQPIVKLKEVVDPRRLEDVRKWKVA